MRELAMADYEIAKTRYEGMQRAKGEFKPTIAEEQEIAAQQQCHGGAPPAALGAQNVNVMRAPSH